MPPFSMPAARSNKGLVERWMATKPAAAPVLLIDEPGDPWLQTPEEKSDKRQRAVFDYLVD